MRSTSLSAEATGAPAAADPRSGRFIRGFDGLRAIAVLTVLVAHAGYERIVPGGTGVTVFFVISGFLITHLLLEELERSGTLNLKLFYVRRFLRLAPEMIALILLCLTGAALFAWRVAPVELGAALFYYMNYYDIVVQMQASFIGGDHSSLLRFVRLGLQSGALALGAVLVVDGRMSGGAVFASSLLLTRSLQPVEQLVAGWKSIVRWRTAYAKLGELFAGEAPREHTTLPSPTGTINIERLTVLTPMTNLIALAEVNLSVAAGEIIGIVGQSGSGKSTLLRAIAGSATASRGSVRFDGASREDWDQEQLALHIGYLPQSFILFPGTVNENIARFRGTLGDDAAMLDAAAIEAARAIGAHEMIQRLPNGYDTLIGAGGVGLSSGQTQVIALPRALFGKPRILLLDEPTAHLDAQTQHAFAKMLSSARAERTTILFSTHGSDLLASTDKLLLLREGRVERFGKLAETAPPFRPVPHIPQRAAS